MPTSRRSAFRRLWPLFALAIGLAALLMLGAGSRLSLAGLSDHLAEWRAVVAVRPILAASLYVAAYSATVAVSIPGSMWLTLAGGLLFGPALGTVLAVTGSTIGATLLFLAVRHALAPELARRAGPLLARVRPVLERDGFSGLLALRLIPVVPFWLVNLAPALVGMSLAPFVAATLLGIVPATLVFAGVGAGLGDAIAHGGASDLSTVLSARVVLPMLGLAALSLLPVVWRRWRAAHG